MCQQQKLLIAKVYMYADCIRHNNPLENIFKRKLMLT